MSNGAKITIIIAIALAIGVTIYGVTSNKKDEKNEVNNMTSDVMDMFNEYEESSNNIKKVAYDESKVIIEDAKKNASRIINNALIKAEKIDSEAMSLKNQVIRYKKRYKNLLEEQLDEVEKLDI